MKAERGDAGRCSLSWLEPEEDGGSVVTGYVVEMAEDGGKWLKVPKAPAPEKEFMVEGLKDTIKYSFRVSATNDVGIGKPSDVTGPIAAKQTGVKPNQPGKPKVGQMTSKSAPIEWACPDNVKVDDKDLQFVVEYCPTKGSAGWVPVRTPITKATTHVVEGLKEGGEYIFRVKAVNKTGEGPYSEPSDVTKYGGWGV